MAITSTSHSEFDRDALIEINSYVDLPERVQAKLIQEAQAGNKRSEATVVSHNMRLVMSHVSAKYRPHLAAFTPGGTEYTDLFNEGAIGVQKAIADYNPARGSFASWALMKVDSQIKQALRSQEDAIRLPQEVLNLKKAIFGLQRDREDAGLKPLTTEQLAERFGKSPERILTVLEAGVVVTSLQTQLESGDELGSQIADTTPDPASLAEADSPQESIDPETIEMLLDRIPERKQQILRDHLIGGKSIEEMAADRGQSASTVGQQLKYAKAMLRKAATNYFDGGAAAASAAGNSAQIGGASL